MTAKTLTPKDAIELGKKHGAEMVDLRFIDLPGSWQHTSVPFKRLDDEWVQLEGHRVPAAVLVELGVIDQPPPR